MTDIFLFNAYQILVSYLFLLIKSVIKAIKMFNKNQKLQKLHQFASKLCKRI